jgi:hypothetical protein
MFSVKVVTLTELSRDLYALINGIPGYGHSYHW